MHAFIRLLTQQLQASFPPTQAYTLHQLRQERLPEALVHYLEQRAIAQAHAHLPVLDDAWFELKAPEILEAYQQLCDRLRAHVRIPAQEWPELLSESVQALVHYLVQPIRTLTVHVFAEAEILPAQEVLQRMRWFRPYAYFHEAIALYLKEKQVAHLERERFTALLARIDQKLTADFTVDNWLRLLRPLYELAGLLPERPSALPTSLLIAFFVEKQQPHLVTQLQQTDAPQVTSETLRALLADTFSSTSEPAEEEPLPLWRRFLLQQRASERTQTPKDTAALPRWMQFYQQPLAAHVSEPPAAELEREVLGETGLRNRELFITHLFRGDRNAYLRTLRRLQATPTWAEASRLIAEEVFRRYQVNIYSEPAIAFTDAVERRYRKNKTAPLQ